MARQPKTQTTDTDEAQTTEIANYDAELAAMAKAAAGMEAAAGGANFFSIRGGILTIDGAIVPNNEMGVIVVNHSLLNIYYEGVFDPDVQSPPTCYAIALGEEDVLAPHKDVVARDQAMAEACADCELNKWASADKGRGKACNNRRRLALIVAGEFSNGRFKAFDDPADFKTAQMAGLTLPVTSVKMWAAMVKQIAASMHLPPLGVFLRVSVKPDVKSQFKVHFELLGQVPKNVIPVLMARRDEAKMILEQPYNLDGEAEAPAAPQGNVPARGRGAKAAAAAAAAAVPARGRGAKAVPPPAKRAAGGSKTGRF